MATRRGYENSEDLKNEIKYLTSLIEQHKNQSKKNNWNSKQSFPSHKRTNSSRQPFHHGNRKWTKTISKTQTDDQVVVKQKYKIVKSVNLTKSQPKVFVNELKPANIASTSTTTVQASSTSSQMPPTVVRHAIKPSSRYKKNNIPLKDRSLAHKTKPHVVMQNKATSKRRAVHRSQMKFIASSRRKSAALQRLYCLYYISYGKCNRGTYCTLVHDKTRVAICPRLLRGKCTDPKCLLSHAVTKEKLPVCSFYIRGNCNVATCSYLHVNVGKDAVICDDFARRGLCKNAEKCEKRHVRICPEFYEKESCSQRNCRLFHYHKKIVKELSLEKKKDEMMVVEPSKTAAAERLEEPTSSTLPHTRSMPVLPDFIKITTDFTKENEASGIRIKPRFKFKPESP